MDNIRATIDVLFNRQMGEYIIESSLGIDRYDRFPKYRADEIINKEWFRQLFRNDYNIYSNDQIDAIYAILNDKWMKCPEGSIGSKNEKGSVFNILLHFTNDVLIQHNGVEPICRYDNLFRWHEMSALVSEDLLTTSFLAAKDIEQGRHRKMLSWRPVITHDNPSVKDVFDRGLAELHFHLKGSSLNFDLNWMSLMNRINDRGGEFKALHKSQSMEVLPSRDNQLYSIRDLTIKACAIRFKLFAILKNGPDKYNEPDRSINVFRYIMKTVDSNETMLYVGQLQALINGLRYEYGYMYGKERVDYAIPNLMTSNETSDQRLYTNSVLSGERWIMYNAFRKIYADDVSFYPMRTLFYAYLVIKERLRHEFIQLNNRIGFGNFGQYESRKGLFIKDETIYDTLVTNLAVNSTCYNQNVKYLEARITPKDTARDMIKAVKKFNSDIDDKRFKLFDDEKYYSFSKSANISERNSKIRYVVHFIKGDDKMSTEKTFISCRNNKLRISVKNKAFALSKLRAKSPKVASEIVAIDAANTEIGYRPEIFAQAFRFLSNKLYKNNFEYLIDTKTNDLGITYHVGEDFLDIVDGLRAIDEAVIFLNLKSGARLGHAFVLGVNAKSYYNNKNKTIIMPKHDFLDNVVWMLIKSEELGITINPKLKLKLNNWFKQYYSDIYIGDSDEINEVSVYTYYQSWLLRGDSPSKYSEYSKPPITDHIRFWDKCSLNHFSNDIDNARRNITARKLYHRYHFDISVRERGDKSEQYNVCVEYIDVVSALQEMMRINIAKQHICIETNLTSNIRIGAFGKYESHPITTFYNHGLEVGECDCPQISVSINTDDQGIFCTSIEKEFSLMALSLEKNLNIDGEPIYKPRMVYKWLENIRSLAFEQRFEKEDDI